MVIPVSFSEISVEFSIHAWSRTWRLSDWYRWKVILRVEPVDQE